MRACHLAFAITLVLGGLAGCSRYSGPPIWEIENPVRPAPPAPLGMDLFFKEAKYQVEPARVRLGRWLFYDTRLSGDGTISCASCHKPERAFSANAPVATGIGGRTGTRKVPGLINLDVNPVRMDQRESSPAVFFWDGRALTLEEQVLQPIFNLREMGRDPATLVSALSEIRGYRPYFAESFGSPDVTLERIASALADYVRTRRSGSAPYDRWRIKKDQTALTGLEKLGYDLFSFKAACGQCHKGSNFTDGEFYNIGIGWDPQSKTYRDIGRQAITGDPADIGKFKVPGLREVSRRAPYMHDGSLATLRDVVEYYNRGERPKPGQNVRIRPLGLTPREITALEAFLRSLEGEGYQDHAPRFFPQ